MIDTRRFSTGDKGFDELLGGGILPGELVELYGFDHAACTALCHRMCASVAVSGGSCMFLDSGNCFSKELLLRAIEEFTSDEACCRTALSNVRAASAFQVTSLAGVLERLLSDGVKYRNDAAFFHSLQLVIVDSIGAIIQPSSSAKQTVAHELMHEIGGLLRRLGNELGVAVMFTNFAISGPEGGKCLPALGESWKFVPSLRILAEAFPRVSGDTQQLCNLVLVKATRVEDVRIAQTVL